MCASGIGHILLLNSSAEGGRICRIPLSYRLADRRPSVTLWTMLGVPRFPGPGGPPAVGLDMDHVEAKDLWGGLSVPGGVTASWRTATHTCTCHVP